jgi:uncharacterized protein YceK
MQHKDASLDLLRCHCPFLFTLAQLTLLTILSGCITIWNRKLPGQTFGDKKPTYWSAFLKETHHKACCNHQLMAESVYSFRA